METCIYQYADGGCCAHARCRLLFACLKVLYDAGLLEREKRGVWVYYNAGRSQMASAYLNHLSAGRIEVRSAGSAPADTVNPRRRHRGRAVAEAGQLDRHLVHLGATEVWADGDVALPPLSAMSSGLR